MGVYPASPNILVAEDDPSIRNLIRILLQQNGYVVSVASDGEEALRLCRETKPDLAIFDVRMPKLDGWQILEALDECGELGSFPIIVLTASPQAATGAEKYAGVCVSMAKPFDNSVLVSTVEECLKAAA